MYNDHLGLDGSQQLSQNCRSKIGQGSEESFSSSLSLGSPSACPLQRQPGGVLQSAEAGLGAVDAPFMFWFISLCQMEVSHADGPNAPDEIYPPGSSCGTVEMKS